MQSQISLVFISLLLLVFSLKEPSIDASLSEKQAYLLSKINEERMIAGVGSLYLDNALNSPAIQHSNDMAQNMMLSHTGSDGSSPSDRAGISVSENVAYGSNLLGIHQALMKSPGHKANILREDSTRVGIGATVSNNYIFVTQVFAGRDFSSSSLTTAEKDKAMSDVSKIVLELNPQISEINQDISEDLQNYVDEHQSENIFTFMSNKGHCCSLYYTWESKNYSPNLTGFSSFAFDQSTYNAIGLALEVKDNGIIKVWAFARSQV